LGGEFGQVSEELGPDSAVRVGGVLHSAQAATAHGRIEARKIARLQRDGGRRSADLASDPNDLGISAMQLTEVSVAIHRERDEQLVPSPVTAQRHRVAKSESRRSTPAG
jgi:hypothetical protein